MLLDDWQTPELLGNHVKRIHRAASTGDVLNLIQNALVSNLHETERKIVYLELRWLQTLLDHVKDLALAFCQIIWWLNPLGGSL